MNLNMYSKLELSVIEFSKIPYIASQDFLLLEYSFSIL